jgi:LysR family nitrogen assimilation transcriptional regulator
MDIRQLHYFVSVIEGRSFTNAAEQLHIAQPALGLQIRKLEEELGAQLLVRHSRGVEPTEAGRMLLDRAREILSKVEETRQLFRDLDGAPRGRITVGLTPSMTTILAARLIRRANDLLPGVSLGVVEELSHVLVEWIRGDRLDLALAYGSTMPPGLATEPLLRENFYFIESANAARGTPPTIALADLAGYSIAVAGAAHGVLLEQTAAAHGVRLTIGMEIQSLTAIRDLVAEDLAVAILPYGGVARMVESGHLSARLIVDPVLSRTYCLVSSDRRPPSAAERAIQDVFRGLVAELIAEAPEIWLAP